MKVTGVKTTLFEHPLGRRMGDANSPAGRVRGSGLMVELTTDEGLTGVALGGTGCVPQIKALVDNILTGEDPRGVRGLWQRMVGRHFKGGHDGVVNDAISALDVALWDLKAKANDEPLWKTLGGVAPRVPCYASGIEVPLSDQEMFDWYSEMAVTYGFKGGKLKVGLDQDADIRRLGLMRDALLKVADRPMLLIDANEYWSPKQAIRKVSEMEEQFDITWVEEPARRWDFLGLKRVSQGVKAAVCAGENLDTLGDFMPYFHHGSADVIQVSAGMTGITCALQIANTAYGFELPVTVGGSPGNFHAHIAPAMPNVMAMEVIEPVPPGGIYTSDVTFEDGWAIPGNKPGTGIEINREALARAAVQTITSMAGPSPFGRRRGAGLYEVPPSAEEKATAAGGVGT